MINETLLNVTVDQPLGDDDSRPSSALVDSSPPHDVTTTITEPSVGLIQKESLSSLSLSPPPLSITLTPKETISNIPVLSMGHQVSPLLIDHPESGTPVFLDRALIIGERNSCLSNEDKMSSLSTILHGGPGSIISINSLPNESNTYRNTSEPILERGSSISISSFPNEQNSYRNSSEPFLDRSAAISGIFRNLPVHFRKFQN